MSTRSDLESRIAEKLRSISDTDMQRVAVAFGQIEYPIRFREIRIRGQNPEGQTTVGWPDAWADLPDGYIDGIEATRAHNQDWRGHIAKDLENARKQTHKLTGFLFVAGHPDARCSQDEYFIWKKQFEDIGVRADNFQIIDGIGLVDRLSHPKFARLRAEILNIPSYPNRFRLVTWSEENERKGAFEPTRREFVDGKVYRPKLTDDILMRLSQAGIAIVLGSGASGKTILGFLITLEPRFRHRPSYYFDVAQYADADTKISNELATDLVQFGHKDSLFVVDNIHINEELVQELIDAWNDLADVHRPQLLLLGRKTSYGKGSRFGADDKTFTLRAREPEVLGVFIRLAHRRMIERDVVVAEPKAEILSNWVRTFGGDPLRIDTTVDLMAFSAAIQHRLEQLLKGNWGLTTEHAREEVKNRYLFPAKEPLTDGERSNLIRLAILPEDFRLPEDALVDKFEEFPRSTKNGLVFEGRGKIVQKSYYFVHAALGKLILTASEKKLKWIEEWTAVSIQVPVAGIFLVRLLLAQGERSHANHILCAIYNSPRWVSRIGGNLSHLRVLLNLFLGQDIASPAELDADLSTEVSALFELALKPPLSMFCSFLRFAEGARLIGTERALRDETEHQLSRFAVQALETPLEHLASVLSYTERSDMEKIRSGLITAVQNHPDKLLHLALDTRFEHLAHFFEYCQRDDLITMRTQLMNTLVAPAIIEQFADRACTEPLSSLTKLFEIRPLADKVMARIDSNKWDRYRKGEEAEQPHSFVNLAKMCRVLQREELAVVPAYGQLVGPHRKSWNPSNINLLLLTNILRLAGGTLKEIADFLTIVATPEWCDRQYENASNATLAGSLFWIAARLERSHWNRFLLPSLHRRVEKSFKGIDRENPAEWLEPLSILGAYSAMGGDTARVGFAPWPNDDTLARIISLREKGPANERISAMENQLWLGLREMARLNPGTLRVGSSSGERILLRARANLPFASPGGFTVKLIEWLERCAQSGWILVRY